MFSGFEIDLVEVLFTLFWVFFFALVLYLHREGKREGYPLVSDRSGHIKVEGFPRMPAPKTFRLASGRTVQVPRDEQPELDVKVEPAAAYPGAPFEPVGDPMLAAVGPGSFANRPDEPETTLEGEPRIVPIRKARSFDVDSRDPDPRGMPVVAADGKAIGTVSDVWIDLAEPQIYFLELDGGSGATGALMVPFGFADIDRGAGKIRVNAIYSSQAAAVPRPKSSSQITMLEEDKIMAYFGGGLMFADDKRREPWL